MNIAEMSILILSKKAEKTMPFACVLWIIFLKKFTKRVK